MNSNFTSKKLQVEGKGKKAHAFSRKKRRTNIKLGILKGGNWKRALLTKQLWHISFFEPIWIISHLGVNSAKYIAR